jgi:anti-sigma-K factor RskA
VIDERTEELATAYVLGALEAGDLALFEAQLREDAELRGLVAELRGVSALLAGTAPSLQPPAALRARLLADLSHRQASLEPTALAPPAPAAARPARAPRSTAAWLPWAMAAGFAALCAFFGWQANGLRLQLDAQQRRVQELSTLADTLRAERGDLRQAVLKLQQSNRLANMRIAVLNSQLKTDPQALAVSVWDNERQDGIVVVHHLKPPPKDKDYQLWIIDPRYPSPVDAGVMHVDDAGDGRAEFKARQPIQNASQFAVTEEIKGGAAAPTLKAMVLAGA